MGRSAMTHVPKDIRESVRPFILEFADDTEWAELMLPALFTDGLLRASNAGLIWTRRNICALSLIYKEASFRFCGVCGPTMERNDIADIFLTSDECELHMIS